MRNYSVVTSVPCCNPWQAFVRRQDRPRRRRRLAQRSCQLPSGSRGRARRGAPHAALHWRSTQPEPASAMAPSIPRPAWRGRRPAPFMRSAADLTRTSPILWLQWAQRVDSISPGGKKIGCIPDAKSIPCIPWTPLVAASAPHPLLSVARRSAAASRGFLPVMHVHSQ